MEKVWEWIKKWFWVVPLASLTLLFSTRNRKWEKEKVKETKEREERIEELRQERENIEIEPVEDFEEVVEEHDEKIQQAKDDIVPFDDPDDIADFIEDYLRERD